MRVYVGMPQHNSTPLLDACIRLNAPIMLSSNRCWDPLKRRFSVGYAMLYAPAAVMIDSSGFVAMSKYGDYRWQEEEYINWIVNDWPDRWPMPDYAAMDFCCENAIAGTRAEVVKRIDRTVKMCWRMFELIDDMKSEGMSWAPYPMPVIQGRTPDDYIQCFRQLPTVSLYGIGSVCGRHLYGTDGLLPVFDALSRTTPENVRFHGFGVKGPGLNALKQYSKVVSVDSMAWDFEARQRARKADVSCSYRLRAQCLEDWYRRNSKATVVGQLRLF